MTFFFIQFNQQIQIKIQDINILSPPRCATIACGGVVSPK